MFLCATHSGNNERLCAIGCLCVPLRVGTTKGCEPLGVCVCHSVGTTEGCVSLGVCVCHSEWEQRKFVSHWVFLCATQSGNNERL